MKELKVGDRVYAKFAGFGTVTSIDDAGKYSFPINVKWDVARNNNILYDVFTLQGQFCDTGPNANKDISLVAANEGKDMETLKSDDAINPSHYKVKGLPEAYEIINHLMHREQYEGFLWGNIIKYAYRYGRKGDKAETAGKIAWYAKKLEEVMRNEI
nr:MAG TPA: nucelotide kinase [Caudoviricetes sp.]